MVPSWIVTLESPVVRMRDSNVPIPALPEYERCSWLMHQSRLNKRSFVCTRHSTINPLLCNLSLHTTK